MGGGLYIERVDGECFGQTSRGPSREEDGKDGQFPAGKCGVEV